MSEKPEALEVADSLERPQPYAYLVVDEARVRAAVRLLRHLHAENERLREALKLALNSHGRMLMSDPPQDAWKFNRVDEVIVAALRREDT